MPQHDYQLPRRRPRRPYPALIALLLIGMLGTVALVIGRALHHRHQPAPAAAKEPRIVSLLPQATDILVSMGCRDHLVAVSNYDADPAVAGLPRVGDYQRTDWETITALRPHWIITHYGTGQAPAGFIERANALGAHQLNLQTETVEGADKTSTIFYAIDELGKACNEPDKAAAAAARLRTRLAAIRSRAATAKRVSTLIVIGVEGTMVAGKGTFLDELLELAGGSNAAAGSTVRYPRVDREQLLAMQPQVILQLMPSASPQVLAQGKTFWADLPALPAVKNNRVVQITDWYALLPGYHVGDLAERFEEALRGEVGSAPSAHSH